MSRLAKKAQQEASRKARLRPVMLGSAVLVVLLGGVFFSGIWEPGPELSAPRGPVTPGRIQIGGEDTLPPPEVVPARPDGPGAEPPVQFYEVLAQGKPSAEIPVEELVVRDLPLPPPAGEDPAPIVVPEQQPAPVVEAAAEVAATPEPTGQPVTPAPVADAPTQVVGDTASGATLGLAAPDAPRPYTLQVGSFSQQARAKELVARLGDAGHDAYTVEVDLGAKGVWWRVRVGHFESAQSAKWAKLDLIKLGVSPIVVRDRDASP